MSSSHVVARQRGDKTHETKGDKTPAIFLISGRAHSGKDTAGDMIARHIRQTSDKTVTMVALAGCLKLVVQRLIAAFYGKKIPIENFYDIDEKERVHHDLPDFHGEPFTIRRALQIIGTEVFRDLMWADIWCDAVSTKISRGSARDVFVVTDCRFPNEVQYFKKLLDAGDISSLTHLKMARPSTEGDVGDHASKHASEKFIETMTADHIILNNGTLQDLRKKLEVLVNRASSGSKNEDVAV